MVFQKSLMVHGMHPNGLFLALDRTSPDKLQIHIHQILIINIYQNKKTTDLVFQSGFKNSVPLESFQSTLTPLISLIYLFPHCTS